MVACPPSSNPHRARRRPSSLDPLRCAVTVCLLGGLVGPGTALAATTLVSVDAAGTASGNGASQHAVVTPNGRYVAFESRASDLTSGDSGSSLDVFVRDLQDGTTTLVSINRFGTAAGNGPSHAPAISDNGRYVAFVSGASDLVEHDDNGVEDVFVRDLKTGVTTLVSINHDGTASGAGASTAPSISANGRQVAFESVADDLVTTDGNGVSDVFVRDVTAGVTTLVSVAKTGIAAGSGPSTHAVLTRSGRYVAFESAAPDLVADDLNDADDVFLRDLRNATTTLVSIARDGAGSAKGDSFDPLVSPNGRYVAFTSRARNLVQSDRNHQQDAYVRDLRAGTTTVASVSKNGKRTANGASEALALTPSGRYVVFSSTAGNVVGGDRNGVVDIFWRDLRTGTTQLVSVARAGGASGNGASAGASISADGRYVVFASQATNLVGETTGGAGDVFLRDVIAATTSLLSARASGGAGGNGASGAPAITPDGRSALFESAASDLVDGDGNGAQSDVFLRALR